MEILTLVFRKVKETKKKKRKEMEKPVELCTSTMCYVSVTTLFGKSITSRTQRLCAVKFAFKGGKSVRSDWKKLTYLWWKVQPFTNIICEISGDDSLQENPEKWSSQMLHNQRTFTWATLIWNSESLDGDSVGKPQVKVVILSAKKTNGNHSGFHFSFLGYIHWFLFHKFPIFWYFSFQFSFNLV